MANGQRNPVLERQWRERVATWTKSGLTVRDFCLRYGVTEPSFHYWRRELRLRDAAASRPPSPPSTPPSSLPSSSRPTFAPVTVIPAATMSVEVRCPSGHVVTLPACEASVLANLFTALAPLTPEARPC